MRPWIPLAAVLLVACYGSHDRVGGAPPPPRDAAPPPFDAAPPPFDGAPPPFDSAPPPPLDAEPPPPFDVGPPPPLDAGPPRDAVVPPPRDAGPPRDSGFDSGIDSRIDSGIDTGPPRPALRFGPGTFFTVDDAPPFDTSFEHTFEVWVRTREVGDADFCAKGDATSRHLLVGQRADRYVMGWELAGVEHLVTGTSVRPGAWVHLALVVRPVPAGHDLDLYVDGVYVRTEPGMPGLIDSFNDRPFRCGFADVDVDEVRVWRVARSSASISSNVGTRISGAVPGLVAYWRLDESGQFVIDYAARGHIGVLGNFTTPDFADPTWILDGAL